MLSAEGIRGGQRRETQRQLPCFPDKYVVFVIVVAILNMVSSHDLDLTNVVFIAPLQKVVLLEQLSLVKLELTHGGRKTATQRGRPRFFFTPGQVEGLEERHRPRWRSQARSH